MSATPRTDALTEDSPDPSAVAFIDIAFARELETELTAMTATAKRLAEELLCQIKEVRMALLSNEDSEQSLVYSSDITAEKALTEAREKGLL